MMTWKELKEFIDKKLAEGEMDDDIEIESIVIRKFSQITTIEGAHFHSGINVNINKYQNYMIIQ